MTCTQDGRAASAGDFYTDKERVPLLGKKETRGPRIFFHTILHDFNTFSVSGKGERERAYYYYYPAPGANCLLQNAMLTTSFSHERGPVAFGRVGARETKLICL